MVATASALVSQGRCCATLVPLLCWPSRAWAIVLLAPAASHGPAIWSPAGSRRSGGPHALADKRGVSVPNVAVTLREWRRRGPGRLGRSVGRWRKAVHARLGSWGKSSNDKVRTDVHVCKDGKFHCSPTRHRHGVDKPRLAVLEPGRESFPEFVAYASCIPVGNIVTFASKR